MEIYTPQPPAPSTALRQELIISLLILLVLGVLFRDSWRTFLAIAAVVLLSHLGAWLVQRWQRSRHPLSISLENPHLTLNHFPYWGNSPRPHHYPLNDYHAIVSYTRRETLEPAALCTVLLANAATHPPLLLAMETLPPSIRWRRLPLPEDLLQRAHKLRHWFSKHSTLKDYGYAGYSSAADIRRDAQRGQQP